MAKHETDVVSLVFGILFTGLALVWALVQGDVLTLPAASVVLPVVLVLAGALGLVQSMRRGLRKPVAPGRSDELDGPDGLDGLDG